MSSIIRVTMIGLVGLILAARVPLAAQTTLTATATASTTVALTWTAVPNATRYWVQRAVGSAALANIGTPAITGTTYTDAAAPAGTQLSYRVFAKRTSGPNIFSNKVSVTTPAAGVAAAPGTAVPVTAVPVTVALVPATLAPATLAPASPATPPPGQPTVAPAVPKATAAGALQPLAVQPLPERLSRTPIAAGPAPENLRVESQGPLAHTVLWDALPEVSGYLVAFTAKAGGQFLMLTPQPIAAPPYQFPKLVTSSTGTSWKIASISFQHAEFVNSGGTYRVTALYPDGRQGSADFVYATPPAPVNPSGFTAKQTGDGQVQLSWQPVNGASYYVLLGPGVPDGGTRVSGATTFAATGVPLGAREWAIASYYEPGPVSTPAAEFPRVQLTVSEMLSGWADLHTHPMVHLSMAGKLVHGGVDSGSYLPQDLSCKGPTRATSMAHALSDDRPSHGGHDLLNFTCGDHFRHAIIIPGFQKGNQALVTPGAARGFPDFADWPKWNDITHQKMWFEWIRRARDGGLRVMVALATNNRTLALAVSGPNEPLPTDDVSSANLQLTEIKSFVGRHNDFMEMALAPADIKRIVQANKIAVVLGVEIDNIGNFNKFPPSPGLIAGEIQRLYNAGVRYVLPIHVMDNAFGGTAIYENGFNTTNRSEAGHFWNIECAGAGDGITHTYTAGSDILKDAGAFVKLGINPFELPPPPPVCPSGRGHQNVRTLTANGVFAIKEMMRRGMIVDIDHMSNKAADATLAIGKTFGYPIVSGHSGIRVAGKAHSDAENSRTPDQLQKISELHGMFGLGTAGVHAYDWAKEYQTAINKMGASYQSGAVSLGTDLNGFVKGPVMGNEKGATLNRVVYDVASNPNSIPKSKASDSPITIKTWDYNKDGVAHYGMLRDFVVDVKTAPAGVTAGLPGSELVDQHLNRSANYFWQMWQRIDARKGSVQ
jgi:microsomal dipeptidase-like Zn-dependent dipeptidase